MLYDSRVGAKVMGILSVPDQLASLSVCPNSGQACVGTVAGRVFTLRCREGTHREEAFGTGKHRSPIVNLSFQNSTIVAGDLGGRVSIIDTSNSATSTRYWSGESLLRPREYLSNTGKDAVNTAGERTVDIEVTAVAHGGADDVWTSFSTTKPLTSHIVSLPL
ncbi:hypothetical protein AGDE_11504 [Angomonas deanei]|nr:hypothetical protein AGDE_11504 [Angomonas deanei]|eukprot:EPY26173.1 hypothetical protein AGDE_11504 [Angomonas deanei]